jgi:hypothetical protein
MEGNSSRFELDAEDGMDLDALAARTVRGAPGARGDTSAALRALAWKTPVFCAGGGGRCRQLPTHRTRRTGWNGLNCLKPQDALVGRMLNWHPKIGKQLEQRPVSREAVSPPGALSISRPLCDMTAFCMGGLTEGDRFCRRAGPLAALRARVLRRRAGGRFSVANGY